MPPVWTGWTRELVEKTKVKKVVDGVEKEVEEVKKTPRPGYLEAVHIIFTRWS